MSLAPRPPSAPAGATPTAGLALALVLLGVVGPSAGCLDVDRPATISVEPTQGQSGTEITIRGESFIDEFAQTEIFFGTLAARPSDIVSITDTEIVVEVPFGAVSGDLRVSVGGVRSGAVPFTVFGPWMLAGSAAARSLTVFDTHTGLSEGIVALPANPVAADFSRFGEIAWVLGTEGGQGKATQFVSADRTVGATVDLAPRPRAVVFDPFPPDVDGRDPLRSEAWVIHEDRGALEILESEGPSVRQRLELGRGALSLDFAPDGAEAFLLREGPAELVVLDANVEVPEALTTISLGARPGPVRVHGGTGKIYVLERRDARILVVDPIDFHIITAVDVGGDPVDMVFSGDLLFVASREAAEIQVINVISDEMLDPLPADPPPNELSSLLTIEGTRIVTPGDDRASVTLYDPLAVAETVTRTLADGVREVRPVVNATGSYLFAIHDGRPGLVTVLSEPDGDSRTTEVGGDLVFLAQQ